MLQGRVFRQRGNCMCKGPGGRKELVCLRSREKACVARAQKRGESGCEVQVTFKSEAGSRSSTCRAFEMKVRSLILSLSNLYYANACVKAPS